MFNRLKARIDADNQKTLAEMPVYKRDQIEAAVRDGWPATIRMAFRILTGRMKG